MSCWISQETYPAGYRPFRPNNNGYHSSRRCYRGGWHRSCPALAMKCFLGITTARIVSWHSRFPYRRCRHCKVFAPAAPRRAWIRVSESISGLLLPQPVPIKGLLGRYPNNNLIGRRPILRRRSFGLPRIPASVAYRVLSPVSRGYPLPQGRLSTCY